MVKDVKNAGYLKEKEQGTKSAKPDILFEKPVSSRHLLVNLSEFCRNLTFDPKMNIWLITKKMGELLGADGAFYSRWDKDLLRIEVAWNVPKGARFHHEPHGRVCTDVVNQKSDDVVVIRHLNKTKYQNTDPHVKALGLATYTGCPARLQDQSVGALCAVWRYDRIVSEEEQALVGLLASAVSVEEKRRQAEESLNAARTLYQTIYEVAEDHIYTKDLKCRYTSANPVCCSFFGKDLSEMVGLTDGDIFDSESSAYIEKMDQRVLKGEIVDQERTLQLKNGFKKEFHVVKVPLISEKNQITGICGIARDVTQTKRLQEELRHSYKMKALGSLARGIAHDFNNILAAIMGYGEIAQERALESQDNLEEIQVILAASRRARDLVRGIMTFGTRTSLTPVLMNLNQNIRQLSQNLIKFPTEGVFLNLDLAENLKPLQGDSGHIDQILMHLVSNAIDAMPQGGELSIKTKNVILEDAFLLRRLELPSGPYLRLVVQDTGCGMDEKVKARIFEPFFTTKEIGKGVGLGLSTVFGIVQSHKGKIICASVPGKGSSFTVYFPACEESYPEEDLTQVSKSQDLPYGTEVVLVVDDEKSLRDLAKIMLRRHGYKVVTAENGQNAIDLYSQMKDEIDLVVMDLGMPGMGGISCLKILKEINPRLKCMVASGYARDDEITNLKAIGSVDFVAKPYRLSDLITTVRKVLDS